MFACSGGEQANSLWAGEYTSPHGVRLTLNTDAGGAITGELFHVQDGVESGFPVQLHAAGTGLEGTFDAGTGLFPLRIDYGDEPGQIVLTSEGTIYELSRKGSDSGNPLLASDPVRANPLAQVSSNPAPAQAATQAPSRPLPVAAVKQEPSKPSAVAAVANVQSKPATVEPVAGANFRHPDGYFSMKVPAHWEANMMADDVFQLNTGVPGELVILLLGDLDPEEVGKPILDLMPQAVAVVDGFLEQNAQIQVDSYDVTTRAVVVGPLQGATSTRPAIDDFGNAATVWQGVVTQQDTLLMLVSSTQEGQASRLAPVLESAFASVRLHRKWSPGDLNQPQASAEQPRSAGKGNASGRNVVINGKRIDDARLASIEGPTPMIPNGKYWYDKKSGMAGSVDGPTEAYLAAGLDLGGPLSPNASGGGTGVAFNGRYLHPIDLAGLEYYFGQIMPGRYWIDGNGNYGQEGGPQEGNLVEEIASIEMLAAAMQSQAQNEYQAQLQAQVQAYQGQGGYYSQGGGYYDQGYSGGGSVYSHFPNLGAGGTGVSVADVGGGDTIVNAGGVLWWPGK